MEYGNDFSPWLREDLAVWGSLADEKYLVHVKAKNVLFNQDEPNSNVFIVKSGRVRLSSFTKEGSEKIFMFSDCGGIFGETTCFEQSAQFFHAATIVDCDLYRIPITDFLQQLEACPQLSLTVHRALAKKIYLMAKQLIGLTFGDARFRVAGVFVDLVHLYGVPQADCIKIELPVTQQGIANLVNSTRLTVGEIIRSFHKEGYIQKKNNRFYVYNLDALSEISTIQ